MSHRVAQVNKLIQKDISEIIAKDLELPLGILLTVTRVKTGSDLKHSKIFVSVLPEEKAEQTLKWLDKRKGFLQKKLAANLTMKFSPKIFFAADETEAYANRIEEILDSLKK